MEVATPAHVVRARPIRRLDRAAVGRLLFGLAAVSVAILAQGALERRGAGLLDSALLLVAAGLVYARAAVGTIAPVADALPLTLPRPIVSRRPHPGLIALAAGVLLNAVGLILFGSERLPNAAWMLYALSVPVALGGVYVLDARPSVRRLLARNRGPALVVVALLLVAAILRLYRLGEIPFGLWFDEAYNGLEILKIMADPERRPVFVAAVPQGQPVLYWYATIPFFQLLGPTQLALRIPTALAGVAGIAAVFLLGRALFGTMLGLTAAAILTTTAWHLTFSRIAFNAVYSVALDAAAVGLLVLGLRTGRRTLFALGGLALGLSQNFYYTSRLVLPVIAIYLVHRLIRERAPFLRQHLGGLVLFAAFAALSASPLVLFALQHPKQFNARVETVTVFKELSEQGSFQPLYDNISKHLMMFNVRGDGNGRHNLPGAPMLEQITAALATIGFFLALTRWRRPEFLFLPVWWLFMLLGGILSLAFEAPQGLRTVDEVVAASLLAALPIVTLAEYVARLAGHARVRIASLAAPAGVVGAATVCAVAVLAIGAANVDRYFNKQANNFAVWNAHSTAETFIGRAIASGDTVGPIYIGETYMEQPTIHFLAPRYKHQRFDPAGALPLRDPAGATIFLEPEQNRTVETIRRLYPEADARGMRGDMSPLNVLYALRVPGEQVTRLQGVEARFWSGGESRGDPVQSVRLPLLDGAPPTPFPSPSYAELRATLAVPLYGKYAFKLEAPAGLSLKLDETEVVKSGLEASVPLARGNHALAVVGKIEGTEPIRLLWRPPIASTYVPIPSDVLFVSPVANNGLLGTYYRGQGWSGEPGLEQIDPSLQMRFHILPLNRPYSVEWRGKVYVPADGTYRFGTTSVDESWLFVDEKMIVDSSRNVGNYNEGAISLTTGFHDIRVRFVDRTGHTFINVFWTPPGRARDAIPTELLFPPLGAYPDKVTPPPPPAPLANEPALVQPPVAPAAAKPGPVAPPKSGAPAKPIASQPGELAGAPQINLPLTLRIGEPGNGPGQFNQPRAVALDRGGNLYVADTANHRIQKFDPAGKPLLSWGSEQDLVEPLGVAVDSGGRVLVLDSEPGWIKRYDAEGKLIDQFGGPDGKFYHPRGFTIDAADNVYIADTGGSRIVKYNGRGEQVAVVGTKGNGPGQLLEPTGVAADAMGGVWVADSGNNRLVRFGPNGAAESEVPLPKAGSFNGPHAALAPDGSLILTDPEGGRLLVFSANGATRGVIPLEGFRRPIGIAVAADGHIYVSDVDAQSVAVLAPLPAAGQ